MSPLDRPAWASLTTAHDALSVGSATARRYLPDVNLFASARDDGADALEALAALITPAERVFILQVPPIVRPPALTAAQEALGVQMVATTTATPDERGDIARLGPADAADMLELATLTRPGPFLARTHVMGDFFGVRAQGRLVAMAGERMRFPGYVEVSGVCTHPDARGQGLARRLSQHVAAAIQQRGDTPFLHAWKTNTPAIASMSSWASATAATCMSPCWSGRRRRRMRAPDLPARPERTRPSVGFA